MTAVKLVDDPRLLAQAFSTRLLRLLASQHHPWPGQRLTPLIALVEAKGSLGGAFEAAYAVLQREYRCEYVYKNEVIARSPAGAHAMTGLRVFLSIADVDGAKEDCPEVLVENDQLALVETLAGSSL